MEESRKVYDLLDQKIENDRESFIQSLQECVAIASVKSAPRAGMETEEPYGEGCRKALDFGLSLGEKMGFRTGNIENRAGYIEFGEGDEMVAALGHLDVVPIGDGWNYPPFEAQIHNGRMYGRGTMDDKGPTIGAVYALKAIRDAGVKTDRRIRVIFGTDEECGSSCMEAYISSGAELPVMGFTPDAQYPLIFFEKGINNYLVSRKSRPSKVLSLKGGTAGNVVTPLCTLVVSGELELEETANITVSHKEGNTIIEAVGVSAHGATPEKGVNAAILLMKALKNISLGEDFNQFRDFILDKLSTNTNGTAMGICYRDDETGETTVNLGVIDYTEGVYSMTLDIRYPKNGDKAVIDEKVMAAAASYGLESKKTGGVDMLYVPKDSEVVQKLMKAYQETTGRDDAPKAIGGGTYAKAFPNMVAFGPQYSEDPETIHAPDEYADIDKLLEAVKVMAAGLYELSIK